MSSSSSSDSSSSSGFDGRRGRQAGRASSSDAGANCCDRGDSSDDDVSLRLVGDVHAQRKFRRLRRIFLSQPQASRMSERPSNALPTWKRVGYENAGDSEDERGTTPRRGELPERDNQRVAQHERRQPSRDPQVPVGPLQEEIDQQIRALCEQVELLSAQRDASANQRECSLRRAIEELQMVKSRQHQALETQARILEESYALRLEVLEKQYQAKVAEIRREMRAAIQKQREECESAVLTAVKQLQQQTQADLFGEIAPHRLHGRPKSAITEVVGGTRASDGKRSDRDAWTFRQDVRCFTQGEPRPAPVSPMARQRAKLHVFEQKLRTLPPASVHRVISQKQQQNAAAPASALAPPIEVRTHDGNPDRTDRRWWQPAPLSPLRPSPSRWRRGVSRASSRARDDDGCSSALDEEESDENTSELDLKSLTRRYLRPEEERELLRLRNSIGLAKDWMENNVQES